MRLEPVLTEKSLGLAKEGNYTFRVDPKLNKFQIKELVEEAFDVKVNGIRTLNKAGEIKVTIQGRKRIIKPQKRAIVTLKTKDLPAGKVGKIDIFEESK